MIPEQPRHLGRGLEVPFGVGVKAKARLVDSAVFADAGEHVLKRSPRGLMGVDVVGRDKRGAARSGQRAEPRQPSGIVAAVKMVGGEIAIPAETFAQTPQRAGEGGIGHLRRQRDDDQAVAVIEHIPKAQMAFALGRAALAESQEPA